MLEEVDYSEESKYDLFESVKNKIAEEWARCLIARMPPSYEDLKKELSKRKIQITEKQYKKICKELCKY